MREFRPSWLIRAAVLAALILWVGVGMLAIVAGGVPGHALAAIVFFVVFFLVFVAHYFRMAFIVDDHGVTYRGATDLQHFDWEDIVQVDCVDVPLGGYYVKTRQGGFVLSSFIKGHRALADLIIRRAGLVQV